MVVEATSIRVLISRWRCTVDFTSWWLWSQGNNLRPLVSSEYEGEWATEYFWLQWGREKRLFPYGDLATLFGYSVCILVNIHTEVFWPPILLLIYEMYPNICFTVTGRLNVGISQIKQALAAKFTAENQENQEELTKHIEKVVKSATSK